MHYLNTMHSLTHLSFVPKGNDHEAPEPTTHAAAGPHPASSDQASATQRVRDIALGRSINQAIPSSPREEEEEVYHDESQDEEEEEDHHNESQGPVPPDVRRTDIKLMDLYPVHRPQRTVEATITSDGDSIAVTGTDICDVTASIVSDDPDVGSFVLHSALSPNRLHHNTRYTLTGTRNEFEPKLYGKPCASAALTKFRNLEIFRVSNRSLSFIVSAYILEDNIPPYPIFYDVWVTILCCAFNVARMQPTTFPSYNRLSRRRQGQYGEVIAAMLPFECLMGKKVRKAEMKDTVTEMPHETGLDFISVFWDVIGVWANLPEALESVDKDALMKKYDLSEMMYGSKITAHDVLENIPLFARSLKRNAIYSARAVGIKSAWQNKPCSVVAMNDEVAIRDTIVAHTASIHEKAKQILSYVANPKQELIIAIDIAHHFAPTKDFTSFLCRGNHMAIFAKQAILRQKITEIASRDERTNSEGESVPTVSFSLSLFNSSPLRQLFLTAWPLICMCISS
jgi:hypothetical protein